jgi:hypothetical protein
MTARARQRLLIFAGLLAAVALIVYMQREEAPAEPGATASNRSGRGGSAGQVSVPVVDLKLERLTSDPRALEDPERDPFRFRPMPAPPPPPRVEAKPAAPPVFQPPPRPAGPPPRPAIPLKFFGLGISNGVRIAYFVDARGNQMYGKEGDIIEGRYRILRIGTDSAELSYLDGGGTQRIGLTGQ